MNKKSLLYSEQPKLTQKLLSRTRASFETTFSSISSPQKKEPIQHPTDTSLPPFCPNQIITKKPLPPPYNHLLRIEQEMQKETAFKKKEAERQKAKQIQKQDPKLKQIESEKQDMYQRSKEFKQRIQILMAYDNEKSTVRKNQFFIDDSYSATNMSLIPCLNFEQHPRIEEFEKDKQKELRKLGLEEKPSGQPVFGILEEIGFSYYALQNHVFFEDLVTKINKPGIMDPQEFDFKKNIIRIQQGQFKSSILAETDRVFFVLHPKSISIYKYTLKDRKIHINDYGIQIMVNSNAKILIPTKCKRLFYLTQQGNLGEVDESMASRWVNPFIKKRHYLKHNQYSYQLSTFIKRTTSRTFFEAIDQFGRHFKKSLTDIFYKIKRGRSSKRVLSFVINEKKKIIACLIIGYDTKIELKCYDYDVASGAQLLLSYSEESIYKKLKFTEQLSQFHNLKQLQIPIEKNTLSNLVLVTRSGVRVFVRVSEDLIEKIGIVYPPNVNLPVEGMVKHPYQQFQIKSRTQSFMIQPLIEFKASNKFAIMSFIQQNKQKVCTYFVQNEDYFESQTINKLKLEIVTDQNYSNLQFKEMPRLLAVDECSLAVLLLEDKYVKDENSLKSTQLHELASQVHLGPRIFVFLNNKGGQLKFKTRIIDTIFMMLFCQDISLSYMQLFFSNLIEASNIHPTQIASMLLQILINKQGVYYVEKAFMEKVIGVSESMGNKRHIYECPGMREQTMKLNYEHMNKDVRKKIMSLLIELQKYKDISSIFKRMIDLNVHRTFSIDQFYHRINEPRQQAIILYFTRLIRPLWYISLKDIAASLDKFDVMLERIGEVKQYLGYCPIGRDQSKINQSLKQFISRAYQVFEVCKLFELTLLPDISFSDCLYQTPEFFEKYVFLSTVRSLDAEDTLNKFKKISSFISPRIFKSLEIYNSFKEIHHMPQLVEKVRQMDPIIPSYILQYLKQYRNFPVDIKIKTYEPQSQQKSQPKIIINMDDSIVQNSNLSKYLKELEQLKNSQQKRVNTQSQIRRIKDIIKIIYVQNILLADHHAKNIDLPPHIIPKLQSEVMEEHEIKSLVLSVQSQVADLILLLNLKDGKSSEFIEKLILNYVDGQDKEFVVERMRFVLKNVYEFEEVNEILVVFMKVLLILHPKDKHFIAYTRSILKRERIIDTLPEIDIFWVPFSLMSWGYTPSTIEQAYHKILNKIFLQQPEQSNLSLLEMFSCVYSYVLFVKRTMPKLIDQRKDFIINVVSGLDSGSQIFEEEMARIQEHIIGMLER